MHALGNLLQHRPLIFAARKYNTNCVGYCQWCCEGVRAYCPSLCAPEFDCCATTRVNHNDGDAVFKDRVIEGGACEVGICKSVVFEDRVIEGGDVVFKGGCGIFKGG